MAAAMRALLLKVAFLLLNNAVSVLGNRVSSLGGSVNLSASQPCRDAQEVTLIRLKDGTEKKIGHFVKGDWEPETDYKDRVTHISDTSVVLNNVNYNDNGVYEFRCDGGFSTVQLEVVVPFEVTTEGETVKLPSYFKTVGGRDVEIIRWEKNGKLVFEQNVSSGNVIYGPGFEGRVSLSPDWFSRGGLSLTLERAQPEDEGDFFIYVQLKDEPRERGDPAAVRLKFTPPPGCLPQSATVCITAAVTFTVVALLAGGFGWWRESH